MLTYKTVETSAEVWAVLRARHPELEVFSTHSDPDGSYFGNPDKGKMFTSFGFSEGDYPLIQSETTWDIDQLQPHKRLNEVHQYWLCIPATP